jgi:hypothetical protein
MVLSTRMGRAENNIFSLCTITFLLCVFWVYTWGDKLFKMLEKCGI